MTDRKNARVVNALAIIKSPAKLRTAFVTRGIRLLKKCWMPLAILLILMAILFSLFRALTPWATQYKGEVEKHLSTLIGQPVEINSMETSWYWFEPVLRLNQVTVLDSHDHTLKLAKLLVGINLLSSIWHWHIQPGILYIDDVHLILRQENNHWKIDGLRQDRQMTTLEPEAYLPVLGWILGQQKIILKNVSAMVHLNDGTLLPLSALNLTAVNNNGHYRLKGEAKLAQTMATELLVLADMKLNPEALGKVSGHAYFSIRHFLPSQWQVFFPEARYRLAGGRGDLEVWLDVSKGHFSGLQTTLKFKRIDWTKTDSHQHQFIQSLKANVAWKPSSDGWQLSADQIKLRAGGIRWPENSLLIKYQKSQQAYRVFVKTVLLEPLLATKIEWPEIIRPVLAVHPKGQLYDTQLGVKEGQIDYALTRFANFGWRQQGRLPEVRNISGVLNWQPTEGRLEIDGENTTLVAKGLAPVTFTQANAAFEWKELSHGLRISMERLVLSHPDFILSARGALDEPFSPDDRNLRLTAEYSLDHAAQWLAYIPSQPGKPKFDHWLKHDIKRIDKASGQLRISGALANFPFDNQPGDFAIDSRLSGMDLSFNQRWPLIRNMDLDVHINKRTFNAEVLHASLQDVETSQANLYMDEIGLDKETLLVHGKFEAPASKIKAYVFSTPLKEPLAKVRQLDIKGPVGLDLNLEVPLYPENDDVLARGTLAFNDNQATFHHALNDVKISKLSGLLQFDEHGVTDSELKARLFGDPVAMYVQSVRSSQPYTEIKIKGDTTIDVLRKKFDLPILAFMDGHLKVESKLTLTDDPNDLDNIQISSSLEGVSIDLPKPLGKSPEAHAPLTIKADFNPEKGVRLRFNYDSRLSSDVWFAGKKGEFSPELGEVRFGAGLALLKKQPGINVVGVLPVLDVKLWSDVWSKLPSAPSEPNLLNSLQVVDMAFGDVIVWGRRYPKVAIHANKSAKDTWSLILDQADIAGALNYQSASNTLSGRFTRLNLAKPDLSNQNVNALSSTLKPADIPNLDITIDALKLGNANVGDVALKSSSTATTWHIDSGNIKSPDYQLVVKGDWQQLKGKNNTNLQVEAQVNNFEDVLKQWNVMPAVEARKGSAQFIVNWPAAINDFSLEKTSGSVYLELKDGRITHLSKETEEKLGLGKLLSVLSLQTIPRRLKLDFSDLSNPGYSFDVFKGNFALKNGVMNTSNAFIDGPVAYAGMKGDLDVVKHLYDIELHISPHITASLPIVATIAGGPIAGIAAWVASKIINQGMQQVTGYTYKISGPWLDPVVQQVSIFKKPKNAESH